MTEKHEAEKLFEEPLEDPVVDPGLIEKHLNRVREALRTLHTTLSTEISDAALVDYLRTRGYVVEHLEAESPTPQQQLLQLAMRDNRKLREEKADQDLILSGARAQRDDEYRIVDGELQAEKLRHRLDKIYSEKQSEVLGEIQKLASDLSRTGRKGRLETIADLAHPTTVFKRWDAVLDEIEEAHEAEEDEKG